VYLNGGHTHPIAFDLKQFTKCTSHNRPGKCNVNITILSLSIYLRFKRINVCSVVAGGGKFPFTAIADGRDTEYRMLLLAWHVKRAVPNVCCRWLIIGCHLVRLVNAKRLTVTPVVVEPLFGFLRYPRPWLSSITSWYGECNTAFSWYHVSRGRGHPAK